LHPQLGDTASALDKGTKFLKLADQERLQSRIQASGYLSRLAQRLLDSEHLHAHAVRIVC